MKIQKNFQFSKGEPFLEQISKAKCQTHNTLNQAKRKSHQKRKRIRSGGKKRCRAAIQTAYLQGKKKRARSGVKRRTEVINVHEKEVQRA